MSTLRPPAGSARWDLVVVGGGTAGIVGARTAAGLGATVLLVEVDRTGGDCLWTGCVPSKALLAAAHAAHAARAASRFGVGTSGVEVDFAKVVEHVQGAVAHVAPVDSPEALRAAGVVVSAGRARFTGPTSLAVDSVDGSTHVDFSQALLATGAAPAVPGLPGLERVQHLTSESVWDLGSLPTRLVVLGGGSIGCELAQAFARLGSEVTVVEAASQVLPREDPAAAEKVAESLTADGVRLELGRAAVGVGHGDDPASAGTLHLDDGRSVEFSHLLVAVGRSPRTTDLGLQGVGVEVDEHGFVRTDDHLRTTNERVWAAGDLTGHPQFTHVAGVHGSLAASNAVLGLRRTIDRTAVPRVAFTQPEVAAVGLATSPSPRGGLRQVTYDHRHVDRAVAEGDTSGFARLVLDRRGRVVGATVVGPRAGETLGELTLAVKNGLRTRDLAGVVHPYPTYNDAPWNAAIDDVRRLLDGRTVSLGVAAMRRLRRWRLAQR